MLLSFLSLSSTDGSFFEGEDNDGDDDDGDEEEEEKEDTSRATDSNGDERETTFRCSSEDEDTSVVDGDKGRDASVTVPLPVAGETVEDENTDNGSVDGTEVDKKGLVTNPVRFIPLLTGVVFRWGKRRSGP